jgi:predicted ATPase
MNSADSAPIRIVFTGAPSSGKTGIIERLSAEPELKRFAFLGELARESLESTPTNVEDWRAFHLDMYRRQVAREKELAEKSFITDRGTIDFLAFNPGLMKEAGTSLETELARYTAVIHLGSTAGLGKEYYAADDIRPDSLEFVLEIEDALKTIWGRHPQYHFVPAEKDYDARVRNVLALVRELSGGS